MYGKKILWLSAIALLAMKGCAPRESVQDAVLAQPVPTAQLEQRLIGNSLYRQGWKGAAKFQFVSHHRADGTMSARSWWFGGDRATKGRWYISDDGLYCRTWDNFWAEGKEGCFSVAQATEDGSLIFDHIRGLPGSDRRYVYQVLLGNPHNL